MGRPISIYANWSIPYLYVSVLYFNPNDQIRISMTGESDGVIVNFLSHRNSFSVTFLNVINLAATVARSYWPNIEKAQITHRHKYPYVSNERNRHIPCECVQFDIRNPRKT